MTMSRPRHQVLDRLRQAVSDGRGHAALRQSLYRAVGLACLLLLLASPGGAQDYPPELPPFIDPIRVWEALAGVGFDEPRDESEVMDVLIVWSAAANFGAVNAQRAVDAANADYQRSLIRGRLRLVGTGQVSYLESSGTNPLSWMSNAGRAEIEAIRESVGADLVHLVTTNNACGQGYLNASSLYPYSQSASSCTIGNRTFQHEIGHNQGAHHDPPSVCGQPTCGGDNYGHGFGSGRTVMAYPAAGGSRLGYFSNPDVLHNGNPTGILGSRNNARVINSRAATVAGFRAPVVSSLTAPTNHRTN